MKCMRWRTRLDVSFAVLSGGVTERAGNGRDSGSMIDENRLPPARRLTRLDLGSDPMAVCPQTTHSLLNLFVYAAKKDARR